MSKLLCVDVSGTLVHHKTGKAIPLMPELVRSAHRGGWRVVAVSRYPDRKIRELLERAGLDRDMESRSSSGSSKGEILRRELNEAKWSDVVFIDDKPENLASVREATRGKARVLGFTGSRKYVPRISSYCRQQNVELALSAIDIAETLQVPLELHEWAERARASYGSREISHLLPGTDHPASAIAGETWVADHRVPLSLLRSMQDAERATFPLTSVLKNAAWIGCEKCLWKTVVELVLHEHGLDVPSEFPAGRPIDELNRALATALNRHPDAAVMPALEKALDALQAGVNEIGADAAYCRPLGREIEVKRVETVRDSVTQVKAQSQDAQKSH